MESRQEWTGSRSCKFHGGLHIVKSQQKRSSNILTLPSDSSQKSLLSPHSKRHFPEKLSPVAPTWKSAARLIKTDAKKFVQEKQSEILLTTLNSPKQQKTLLPKYKFNNKNKQKPSECQQIPDNELLEVRNLAEWEKTVLNTRVNSPELDGFGFRSKAERCTARLSQALRNRVIF